MVLQILAQPKAHSMKYLFQKSVGLLACLKCLLRCLEIRDSMGRKSDSHYSFHRGKLLFFRMNFLFVRRKSSCILFNMNKLPKEKMACDTKPDRLLRTVQSVFLATFKWQPLSLAVDRVVDTPLISCLPPTLLSLHVTASHL